MENAMENVMEPEELFDAELRAVLGPKYKDKIEKPAEKPRRREQPEEVPEPIPDDEFMEDLEEEKLRDLWPKAKALLGLVAGVGLLLWMSMNGKIDPMFGTLFVAGISTVAGYHMR